MSVRPPPPLSARRSEIRPASPSAELGDGRGLVWGGDPWRAGPKGDGGGRLHGGWADGEEGRRPLWAGLSPLALYPDRCIESQMEYDQRAWDVARASCGAPQALRVRAHRDESRAHRGALPNVCALAKMSIY